MSDTWCVCLCPLVSQIEKVFTACSQQKVWDHFTKPQRRNIDMWKKQAQVSAQSSPTQLQFIIIYSFLSYLTKELELFNKFSMILFRYFY